MIFTQQKPSPFYCGINTSIPSSSWVNAFHRLHHSLLVVVSYRKDSVILFDRWKKTVASWIVYVTATPGEFHLRQRSPRPSLIPSKAQSGTTAHLPTPKGTPSSLPSSGPWRSRQFCTLNQCPNVVTFPRTGGAVGPLFRVQRALSCPHASRHAPQRGTTLAVIGWNICGRHHHNNLSAWSPIRTEPSGTLTRLIEPISPVHLNSGIGVGRW